MKKFLVLLVTIAALVGCTTPAPVLVFKTASSDAPTSSALTPPPSHRVGGFTPTPTGTGLAKVSGGSFVSAAATLVDADVASNAAIAYSKFGGSTQSYSAQEFDSTVDTKGTLKDRQPVNVQTTDATVTTLDSWTIASNSAQNISALVIGLKSDSSQAGAWSITCAFRNNAGTVAQLGSTSATVIGTLDDAAWAATCDNSTTTIRIRVTGKAATTIRWTVATTRLEVIP